jgi:DNA sulfur modification protein DndB
MRTYIFDVFRAIHGDKLYWDKGVSDKTIKSNAYSKSLDVEPEERLPLETYLDVIEMKKIVENKVNWPLFKEVFNIAQPGEKGFTKNVKWMENVNELRRIPAHPARERRYKIEDFDYIDFIYEEFLGRVASAQANPVLEADADHGDSDE